MLGSSGRCRSRSRPRGMGLSLRSGSPSKKLLDLGEGVGGERRKGEGGRQQGWNEWASASAAAVLPSNCWTWGEVVEEGPQQGEWGALRGQATDGPKMGGRGDCGGWEGGLCRRRSDCCLI